MFWASVFMIYCVVFLEGHSLVKKVRGPPRLHMFRGFLFSAAAHTSDLTANKKSSDWTELNISLSLSLSLSLSDVTNLCFMIGDDECCGLAAVLLTGSGPQLHGEGHAGRFQPRRRFGRSSCYWIFPLSDKQRCRDHCWNAYKGNAILQTTCWLWQFWCEICNDQKSTFCLPAMRVFFFSVLFFK